MTIYAERDEGTHSTESRSGPEMVSTAASKPGMTGRQSDLGSIPSWSTDPFDVKEKRNIHSRTDAEECLGPVHTSLDDKAEGINKMNGMSRSGQSDLKPRAGRICQTANLDGQIQQDSWRLDL